MEVLYLIYCNADCQFGIVQNWFTTFFLQLEKDMALLAGDVFCGDKHTYFVSHLNNCSGCINL